MVSDGAEQHFASLSVHTLQAPSAGIDPEPRCHISKVVQTAWSQLLNQELGRSRRRGSRMKGLATADISVFCIWNLWEGIWGEQEVRGAILKVMEICSALFPFQRQSQQECTGIFKWLQAQPWQLQLLLLLVVPLSPLQQKAPAILDFNPGYIQHSLGSFSCRCPEVELLPGPFTSLSCTSWLHQNQLLTRQGPTPPAAMPIHAAIVIRACNT